MFEARGSLLASRRCKRVTSRSIDWLVAGSQCVYKKVHDSKTDYSIWYPLDDLKAKAFIIHQSRIETSST